MNDLVIRPLRDDAEARACAALIAVTDPWKSIKFPAEQVLPRLLNPKREVFVAGLGPQLAGALILHLDGLLNGYVQTIVIFSEFQNRGLGGRLMAFAEDKIFRQSPNVFLCVAHFNHRAQKFYDRLGYRKVGELENYLQSGMTEILMRKTRGPLLEFSPQK
jgi:ribosomal protein S18 acetylase RimI-like enzyme